LLELCVIIPTHPGVSGILDEWLRNIKGILILIALFAISRFTGGLFSFVKDGYSVAWTVTGRIAGKKFLVEYAGH
jgi:hypothetical protein